MKLDLGTILVALATLFFYVRFLILRGRKKAGIQARIAANISGKQNPKNHPVKKSGAAGGPFDGEEQIRFKVASWWFFGGGFLLTCLGVAMRTSTLFTPAFGELWWIPTSVGILILGFSFK